MATKIYTAIEVDSVNGAPVVGTATIKVAKTGATYTATGDQDQIDIIDALGTWTPQ